ncbi:MAG TPA: hypothetical protein VMW54_06670 [Terriglobia bacterium]|nr:hypothetical protein [Terriglobia bacterium]
MFGYEKAAESLNNEILRYPLQPAIAHIANIVMDAPPADQRLGARRAEALRQSGEKWRDKPAAPKAGGGDAAATEKPRI